MSIVPIHNATHPVPCPVPGQLRFNTSLCVPCPAGWICLAHVISSCGAGTWSPQGSTSCLLCSVCAPRASKRFECMSERDTVCRSCPVGFTFGPQDECIDNGTAFPLSGGVIIIGELILLCFCVRYLLLVSEMQHGSVRNPFPSRRMYGLVPAQSIP